MTIWLEFWAKNSRRINADRSFSKKLSVFGNKRDLTLLKPKRFSKIGTSTISTSYLIVNRRFSSTNSLIFLKCCLSAIVDDHLGRSKLSGRCLPFLKSLCYLQPVLIVLVPKALNLVLFGVLQYLSIFSQFSVLF